MEGPKIESTATGIGTTRRKRRMRGEQSRDMRGPTLWGKKVMPEGLKGRAKLLRKHNPTNVDYQKGDNRE